MTALEIERLGARPAPRRLAARGCPLPHRFQPGALRLAEGTPVVDQMIANGERRFREGAAIPHETAERAVIRSAPNGPVDGCAVQRPLEGFLRAAKAS